MAELEPSRTRSRPMVKLREKNKHENITSNVHEPDSVTVVAEALRYIIAPAVSHSIKAPGQKALN